VPHKIYSQQDLTGIELRLWEAVTSGEEVVAQPHETVRADIIRQIAMRIGVQGNTQRLLLRGATVTGTLDFEAARLLSTLELTNCDLDVINVEQATAPAIYLRGCHFSQLRGTEVHTDHGLSLDASEVSGKVHLVGASIGGALTMDGTKIMNPGGRALVADGMHVSQDLRCNAPFEADGESQMIGAEIMGQFSACGGKFTNRRDLPALRAPRLIVRENAVWRKFRAEGDVNLQGAIIDGYMHLKQCHVTGDMDLTGSAIGGSLECSGATFENTGKIALDLARAHIKQHVTLQNGFSANGQVLLAGAMIGGDLSCEGGQFTHETDSAILADALKVDGDVTLSTRFFDDHNVAEQFVAKGQVTLTNATIGGSLNCMGAKIVNDELVALKARCLRVTRSITFDSETVIRGAVDLRRAAVGELHDVGFEWPARVFMRRFVYDSLYHPSQPSKADVKKRIRWLNDRSYSPQIYNQLAQVYRSEGYDEYAESVLISKEWAQRTKPWDKLKGFVLWVTVGYGFSPLRILIWLGALEVLGGILFTIFHEDIRPRNANAAPFQPWLYTLDLLLPVINLKQRDFFIPESTGLWLSVVFTITGWILGTVLAIGVVHMIKRSD
jgi:hypothetical protein